MNIQEEIASYIQSQKEPKKSEMQTLHLHLLELLPDGKLWFLDGKNSENKVIANPNIGYGSYQIKYANGTTKDFYQIGMSANTTGISIYIMGIEDKKKLSEIFGSSIGKATITGYCIKFKSLQEINLSVLDKAIEFGLSNSQKG